MKVHVYEKAWMIAAGLTVVLFLATIGVSTFAFGIHPPSHVETIDPTQVFQDERFAKIGEPIELEDGTIEIRIVATMFAFVPNEIHVPAGRSVRFRLTSSDVTHGFGVARTNVNTMVVPGYISQLTTRFVTAGDYLIVCNEFCGNGHHAMHGRLIVEPVK